MAKRMISIYFFLTIITSLFTNTVIAANFNIDFTPQCEALYLYNLDTETVAYEKNGQKKMYPASLTKVMTYIITAESINNFDNVTITIRKEIIDKILGTGSSVANLKAGDTLTVTQLLHCMMIKSGNDAALVLADYIGNGDVDKFVQMMNDKATELGCQNTHFMNPHGLHDDNHYTTAQDLGIMTKYAMTLQSFMDISSQSTSYILGEDKYPLVTTNSMIDQARGGKYYYQYARGIKTGHTDEAGYCLVSSAVCNGYSYICVALGAPIKDANGNAIQDNYAMLDSKALYKWAFTNLELKQVLKKNDPISEINLKLTNDKDSILLYPAENYSVLMPKSVKASSVDIRVEKPDNVDAPIKTGQKIGSAVLSYANRELARIDLVAAEDVDRNLILYIIQCIGNIISSVWFKITLGVVAALIIIYIILFIKYNHKARRKRTKMTKKYK